MAFMLKAGSQHQTVRVFPFFSSSCAVSSFSGLTTTYSSESCVPQLQSNPAVINVIQINTLKRGDNKYEQYTCTGANCPFCNDGEKATYKGAYLVVDRREFSYKDKEGKQKTGKNQVRLFVQGMKVISQLDRISDKYGLSNRDVTIVRLGKGTQTTYTIERGDEEKISTKEVENLLPDKLRDDYDGTMDSLMSIVEEQLMMATKDYSPSDDDEGAPFDEDDVSDGRDKLISADDEQPTRKLGVKKSMFKKPQNSIKPRAKSLLKK